MTVELMGDADATNYADAVADRKRNGQLPQDYEIRYIHQLFKLTDDQEYIGAIIVVGDESDDESRRWIVANADWDESQFNDIRSMWVCVATTLSPSVRIKTWIRNKQRLELYTSSTVLLDRYIV